MDIVLWILFGLVVGLVAKLIMPGRDPGGAILTIVSASRRPVFPSLSFCSDSSVLR